VKLRRSARGKAAQSPPPSESSESPSASGEEERTGEDAWSGFVGDAADPDIHISDDDNDEEDAHGEPDLE
jgi:hypothetical protein